MTPSFRRIAALLFATATMLCNAPGALAAYPDRPIRLIVGFAAGGGTDVLARLIGQKLSKRLGQPIIVENRAGANTIIATEATARAAPDGYTLGIVPTPITANPSLYKKLPYDTARDFTWITQLTTAPLALLISNSVPANNVQQLIALAKKEPGKLTYGSGGAGGSPHLAAVLLERMANIEMVHVPYKGNAPAITDLIAGRISILFGDIPQVMPFIKSGKVKAVAVTSTTRSAALPDVPTIAESGLPDYVVPVWYGIVGPAKMPKDVVNTLYRNLKDVLADPDVRKQLTIWGVSPVGSTPDEFAAFVKSETAKWNKTIKAANIHLD